MVVLVVVRYFNLPDVFWKYNTAEGKQPRRFLDCVEENSLMQLMNELSQGRHSAGPAGLEQRRIGADVVVRGCLGYSHWGF